MGKAPFRRTWATINRPDDSPKRYISRILKASRFSAGLFPLHSPLLRESLLVSFPPLSNMLKFSGSSRLIRGRNEMVSQSSSWSYNRHSAYRYFQRGQQRDCLPGLADNGTTVTRPHLYGQQNELNTASLSQNPCGTIYWVARHDKRTVTTDC